MKNVQQAAKEINHNPILKIILLIAIFLIPITLLLFIAGAVFDMIQIGTGCLKRYGPDGTSQTVSQSTHVTLNATGNNSTILYDSTGNPTPTSTSYGNWTVSDVKVKSGDQININVSGTVSLCRASLMANNIHTSPNNSSGVPILLPKVEENDSASYNYTADPMILNYGVPITFPANQNQWLSIAKLEKNDNIQVFVYPQYNSNPASVFNVFQSPDLTTANLQKYTANCSNGQTSYNSICGLYSFYWGSYATSCKSTTTSRNITTYSCSGTDIDLGAISSCCCSCCSKSSIGTCLVGCGDCCIDRNTTTIYNTTYSVATSQTMPIAYNGSNAFPPLNTSGYSCNSPNQINGPCCQGIGLDTNECIGCNCWTAVNPNSSLSTLLINYTHANNGHNQNQCCAGYTDTSQTPDTSCTSDYYSSSTKNFWMTGGNGLLYQISSNSNNGNQMGNSYNVIAQNNRTSVPISIYNVSNFVTQSPQYLQYYFYDNGNANNNRRNLNTGGVVLGLKQTKCVRINGVPLTDSSSGGVATGAVQYTVLTNSSDSILASEVKTLNVDSSGNASIYANNTGYLALKIVNTDSQYQNSTGQYNLTVSYNSTLSSFNSLLNDLIQRLKTTTLSLGTTIASNLICYNNHNTSNYVSNCADFFQYIRALLSLYVIIYAMMFILGFFTIKQYDLIVRLTKIALISGLISGGTFTYFSTYILPILYNATDELIANIGGYVPFDTNLANTSSLNNVRISNPMGFLDELFSKIFFSKTFFAQTMSLLGIGLSGIIYFYILLVTIVIVVLSIFRAILVYILSFMGLAIMISIAPIVLTLSLFSYTSTLFKNWLNAVFRYIMDPVILMIGIIVLTQLFTVFLDFTLNFSVCWKCTLPIYLPFFGLEKFLGAVFTNHPLYCIYWYGPWGIDPTSYSSSYPMTNYIMLFIISYTMYGYINIADEVSTSLCFAGSSAINSAINMTNDTMSSIGGSVGKLTGLDAKSLDKKIDAVFEKIENKEKPEDKEKLGNKEKIGGTDKTENIEKPQNAEKTSIKDIIGNKDKKS